MSSEAELEDELAIQRTILSSLDGHFFDGVETERAEIRATILEIQRRLRHYQGNAHAHGSQAQQNGESSSTGSGLRYNSQQSAPSPARAAGEHRPSTPSTPARLRDQSSMALPQYANDIWSDPGSGSLASHSRKRTYDTTTLGVKTEKQSKSRRPTPTPPSGSYQSPFSTQGSEVIDLTGLDDGDDARDYLARQKREEDRRAQERRDREFAMSISANDGAPPFQSSSSGTPSLDAFSRLMDVQRANAPDQRSSDDGPSSFQSFSASHQHLPSGRVVSPPAFDETLRLPGAYDPLWDEVRTAGPSDVAPVSASPYGSVSSSRLRDRHSHTPSGSSHGPVGPLRVVPEGHTGGSGGPYNQFTYPWMAPVVPNTSPRPQGTGNPFASPGPDHAGMISPGSASLGITNSPQSQALTGRSPRTRTNMPAWGSFRQQMQTGALNGTLSSIINSTSQYDFANRIDGMGNPLPSHLHRLLDDTELGADPEMTARELEELLQNIEPDIEVPKNLQGVKPDALKTPLYKHQEVALTWMKKMENGTNKGGILADDMGLGKTISTLALIHERKSSSRPKTNLIIAPVALMRQWEEEIKMKTESRYKLSVFVYHGKKASVDHLLGYDVVLTTYGTVAAQLKRLEKWHEDRKDRALDYNDRDLAVKCPLLHPQKSRFHRVILDEAQCIKNKDTQTAKACHLIDAKFRWCLTGTPMMNGVSELYSLLKFLRIRPYNSWVEFRQAFGTLFGKRGDSKSIAMRRLQTLLKAILLRRKKNSLIDGKPIVELPKKTEEVSYATLSTDERDFYTQLESKAQVIFNKYLREGSVGKNYANVLVLLLRLRQACCHPHLNLDVDDAVPAVDDDMLERVKRLEPSTVDRIKQIEAFECPVCYDAVTSPTFFFPCGHDCCRPCLAQLVDNAAQSNIQAGNESGKAKCIACRAEFSPKECFSFEAFQEVHMPDAHARRQAEIEAARDNDTDGSDSDESDYDSDAQQDADDEGEVNVNGDLAGFVVSDSADELDEPLPPVPSLTRFSRASGKQRSSGESSAEEQPEPKTGVKTEVKTEVKSEVKSEVKGEIKGELKNEDEALTGLNSIPQATTSAPGENATTSQASEASKTNKETGEKNRKNKGKGKGKKKAKTSDIKPSMLKALRQESFKNRKAYKKYMAYLHDTWLPSAKVDECVRLLKEFRQGGQKTIIFSQWTLLLDLIEVAMDRAFKEKPLRYDGSMSATERAIAAQSFRDKKDCSVLLVSLRAGNAGLNLTAASRVIIMDPFWNPYIEMQAVDRAYRIGQKNEVKVYRILTQETVEDRIVELQERKKEMVEAALDETAGKAMGRLSVKELKFLFTGR